MKATVLAILLSTVGLRAYGQQLPAPAPTPSVRTEEYCELRLVYRLNRKATVTIDYGRQPGGGRGNVIRDAEGRPVEFNSAVDALNWLNAQGWELVNAYGVGDNTSYILRRRLGA